MYTRFILIVIVALSFCASARAQGTEPTVKGFMVTGAVSSVLSNASEVGGVRYWDKYFGGDLTVGAERVAIDTPGTDVIKANDISVNGGMLIGFPAGRVKPFVRIGFGYSYLKDYVSDVKLQTVEMDHSVGIDFMASQHLLFGINIVSFSLVVAGDVNGASIGGSDFSFLNQVRVGYVF